MNSLARWLLAPLCATPLTVSPLLAEPVVEIPGYSVELVATGARQVSGITIGTDGFVYVTDWRPGGSLFRVPLAIVNGTFETVATGFDRPSDVDRTPDGRLFVTEPGEATGGRIVEVFLDGSTSVLASGFSRLFHIEYTPTGFVTVNSESRVTLTSLDGQTTTTILSGLFNPTALTVLPSGRIYFAQFPSGGIFQSDLSGKAPSQLGDLPDFGPTYTTIAPDGTLFVSDPLTHVIWRLDAPNNFAVFASGLIQGPSGLEFDAAGNLLVGDGASLWRLRPPHGDSDGDGIADEDDALPFNPTESTDTDSDGIGNNADSDDDGDGLPDNHEIDLYGTDPLNPDTDGDGLSDIEILTFGTDPNDPDSDGDGLQDGAEVNEYGSDPNVRDSDGDGFDDGFEVSTGFDPASATSTPDTLSSIRTAVEFRFNAAQGETYRIEASTDLEAWETIEDGIAGNGGVIVRFYSTEAIPFRAFRARRN